MLGSASTNRSHCRQAGLVSGLACSTPDGILESPTYVSSIQVLLQTSQHEGKVLQLLSSSEEFASAFEATVDRIEAQGMPAVWEMVEEAIGIHVEVSGAVIRKRGKADVHWT